MPVYLFLRFVLLGLSVTLLWGASVAAQTSPSSETLHLSADSLVGSAEPRRFEARGGVRLFLGPWRLLAGRLLWLPDTQLALARGGVALQGQGWELQAEAVDLQVDTGFVQAAQAELQGRGWTAQARQAELSQDVWRLHDVRLTRADLPLSLAVTELQFFPASGELVLIGLGLSQGPRLPLLQLRLPELATDTPELRPPISLFQPELALVSGGLSLGASSQLWQSETQRLYARLLSDPLRGFSAQLAHEWRPQDDLLLNTQLGLAQPGARNWADAALPVGEASAITGAPLLTARLDGLWRSPWGIWLRPELSWQHNDDFWNRFWLPPLRQGAVPSSGAALWLASERNSWAAGEWRVVAGGRLPQQQAGLSLMGHGVLWADAQQALELHGLANALWTGLDRPSPQGTLGLRLLERWFASDKLELSGYLEHYLSSLSPSSFVEPERLSPRVGGYALWRLHPQLALGLESALSLRTGQLVQANVLLSTQWGPLYLHGLVQAFPVGVQLQTRFEWD
ncbi:MAG: hypothetical protein ACO1RX_16760 [Candidatus Sericytochromatia bacterium]